MGLRFLAMTAMLLKYYAGRVSTVMAIVAVFY